MPDWDDRLDGPVLQELPPARTSGLWGALVYQLGRDWEGVALTWALWLLLVTATLCICGILLVLAWAIDIAVYA